jgi:hypothetical protein
VVSITLVTGGLAQLLQKNIKKTIKKMSDRGAWAKVEGESGDMCRAILLWSQGMLVKIGGKIESR